VQDENNEVTDIGAKLSGLNKTIDGKSTRWKAEDNLETA
jgi:hypothetical protein